MKRTTVERIKIWGALFAALWVVLFAVSGPVFATSVENEDMPWETPLETLQASLTGPVAGIVSLIAIIGAGALLLFGGNIQGFMRTAVYLVLVIGLVVGASSLLTGLYSGASINIPVNIPVGGLPL
jgi:type IV secretion system protein VirB2